jgi:hypothetical protein
LDFFDTLRILRRHWLVVLVMLIVTFGAVAAAFKLSSTQYQATSSLLLAAPAEGGKPTINPDGSIRTNCSQNPYCVSGDFASLGDVVALAMSDREESQAILSNHPGATYEVILSPDDRSPIVNVTGTASSASSAMATLRDTTAAVNRELNARQQRLGVPSSALITFQPVVVPTSATVQAGGRLRASLAVLGIGLALTFAAALIAESRSKKLARARLRPAPAGEPSEADVAGPAELSGWDESSDDNALPNVMAASRSSGQSGVEARASRTRSGIRSRGKRPGSRGS